jgi:ABC-type ATPase involved in cell division
MDRGSSPESAPPASDTAKGILVVGNAGAGKSSFIKLAIGADVPVGHLMHAGTHLILRSPHLTITVLYCTVLYCSRDSLVY